MYVNLLPEQFCWARLLHRRIQQWGVAVVVTATLIACLCIPRLSHWYHTYQTVDGLRKSCEPVQDKLNEQRELQRSAERLRTKTRYLRELIPPDHLTSLLGMMSQISSESVSPLWIQELAVVPKATPAKSNVKAPATPSNETVVEKCSQVTIRGMAENSDALNRFIESLNNYGVFVSVDLKTAHETKLEDKVVQEFEMECTYENGE